MKPERPSPIVKRLESEPPITFPLPPPIWPVRLLLWLRDSIVRALGGSIGPYLDAQKAELVFLRAALADAREENRAILRATVTGAAIACVEEGMIKVDLAFGEGIEVTRGRAPEPGSPVALPRVQPEAFVPISKPQAPRSPVIADLGPDRRETLVEGAARVTARAYDTLAKSANEPEAWERNDEVLADMLSLVEMEFTAFIRRADVGRWDDATCREVEEWAAAAHLRASDNDVDVPPLPKVLGSAPSVFVAPEILAEREAAKQRRARGEPLLDETMITAGMRLAFPLAIALIDARLAEIEHGPHSDSLPLSRHGRKLGDLLRDERERLRRAFVRPS